MSLTEGKSKTITTTTRTPAGSLNGSTADIRDCEILDELGTRHPESKEMIDELDDLIGELWNQAEAGASRRASLFLRSGELTLTDDGGVLRV
jgi:hypothetical protein